MLATIAICAALGVPVFLGLSFLAYCISTHPRITYGSRTHKVLDLATNQLAQASAYSSALLVVIFLLMLVTAIAG